jgi:hypothetical protein
MWREGEPQWNSARITFQSFSRIQRCDDASGLSCPRKRPCLHYVVVQHHYRRRRRGRGEGEGACHFRRLGVVRGKSAGWPAELDLICRWYMPHLDRLYEDAVMRQADLAQLVQIASTYPTRERFLTELTLDPPDATSDEAREPLLDEDYLTLSTIHSAKGQEWRAVFILNAIEGCIPSDLSTGDTAEIEEERRLLYVGMTRAKDRALPCS